MRCCTARERRCEFEHAHAQGSAKIAGYKKDYHQVTDEYRPEWDLPGMVQHA